MNQRRRPLLYAFQHHALPRATFENDWMLNHELGGAPSSPPLSHFWNKALLAIKRSPQLHQEVLADPECIQRDLQLRETITFETHQRKGYTIHVIQMPEPIAPPEAHYTAIIHRDGELREPPFPSPSTRYATLELSSVPNRPVVGEWRADGSRGNHGQIEGASIAGFLDAIHARVLTTPPPLPPAPTGDGRPTMRVSLDAGSRMLMLMTPTLADGRQLVRVEFEDGTVLHDLVVFERQVIELPLEHAHKKIARIAVAARAESANGTEGESP